MKKPFKGRVNYAH